MESIRLSFEVGCTPGRAFELWTTRLSTWWPTDHSVSGDSDLEVTLEGFLGGRIYERTSSGQVYEWGRVTEWDPPRLLAYTWHLGADPDTATEVLIRFGPGMDGGTRIDIDHGGWTRLGVGGTRHREDNLRGWDGVLPLFIKAADEGGR